MQKETERWSQMILIKKSDWLIDINFIGFRAPSRQYYFETLPEQRYGYILNLKAGVFLTFVYH